MEWQVRYEPLTQQQPWSVYKVFDGQRLLERGFLTEEEARHWAAQKEIRHERPQGEPLSKVEEASLESFPASDPPAWTKTTVHGKSGIDGRRGKLACVTKNHETEIKNA
mgnify:CR=1 FL=1